MAAGDFEAKMKARADALRRNATAMHQRVSTTIMRSLVLNSPIDTGRLMANWAPAIDRKGLSYRFTAYVPGVHGSTFAQNAAATLNNAGRIIAAFDATRNKSVWITNYLPYTVRQNYEHKAKAGWVQRAVKAGAFEAGKTKLLSLTLAGANINV